MYVCMCIFLSIFHLNLVFEGGKKKKRIEEREREKKK